MKFISFFNYFQETLQPGVKMEFLIIMCSIKYHEIFYFLQ